jgi:membrane fusion protein (multidrug efflux system)
MLRYLGLPFPGAQRLRRSCGLVFLSLVGLVLGCAGKPAPPAETAPPAPVELATIRELVFGEWTELLGATQPLPNHSARIAAAVEGRVLWLLHDPGAKQAKPLIEGQRVEKGQVIGRLDDRLVRANRDKLQASLEGMKEQRQQAEYAVETAQIEVNRLTNLRSAMNGVDLPLANRIELEKARIALKDAESKRKASAATLEAAQAELKGLNEQLDWYVLRAPITGRLGPVQAVPGQTLAIGAVVAEVLDLDDIDVLCYVPPYTASRLAIGQKARIIVPKDSPSMPAGKIEFIAVQAQPDTGSFAVKARFPNPDLRLRGGSILRIEALTSPEKPRVTIPESALLEDQEPPAVVIVKDLHVEKNAETGKEEKIGTARKVRARIGIRNREWHVVEILGLEELKKPEKGEQVRLDIDEETQFVTKGGHGLEDGDKVKQEEDED